MILKQYIPGSGGHWYHRLTGEPCHEVPRKDGNGMRKTTLADAKKMGCLLPSVTTVTNVLAAPALTVWLKRNAAIAAITTPRIDGESLDDFLDRVMAVDSESIGDAAKKLGSDVHDAIEKAIAGQPFSFDLAPFIAPTLEAVAAFGKVTATEKIMLAKRYAGRCDCICEGDTTVTVIDFKTTGASKLPAKSYPEHRLQLAAYANIIETDKPIKTANIYISTARPGEIKVCVNEDWQADMAAFEKVVDLWAWSNSFSFPQ